MKFSIRDLLLVTVILALGLGWWGDHSRLKMDTEALVKEIDLAKETNDFLLALRGTNISDLYEAANHLFVAGIPASKLESILATADSKEERGIETRYHFLLYGKNHLDEWETISVVVDVADNPPQVVRWRGAFGLPNSSAPAAGRKRAQRAENSTSQAPAPNPPKP